MSTRLRKTTSAILIVAVIGSITPVFKVEAIEGNGQQQDPPPTPRVVNETQSRNGSHHGASTDTLMRFVNTLLEQHLGLPIGYLHGMTYRIHSTPPIRVPFHRPLTEDEQLILCKVQAMLNRHDDFQEARNLLSVMLSEHLHLPHGAIYHAISPAGNCEGVLEVRHSEYNRIVVQVNQPKPTMQTYFAVDASGIPVSSNPAWNACIRNTITYDRDGRPFQCRRYHSGNKWYHPDLRGVEFAWNDRDPRGISLPESFILVQLDDLDGRELLAQAAKTNRTEAILYADTPESIELAQQEHSLLRNIERRRLARLELIYL